MKLNKAKTFYINKERVVENFNKHRALFDNMETFGDTTVKVVDLVNHPMLIEFCVIANSNQIFAELLAPSVVTVWSNIIFTHATNKEPQEPIAEIYTCDDPASEHLRVFTSQAVPTINIYRNELTFHCENIANELKVTDTVGLFLIVTFALQDLLFFLNSEAKKFMPEPIDPFADPVEEENHD